MKSFILAAVLTLGAGSFSFAGELDNESSITNQSMNGTVVIRVDTRNNQASILTSNKPMTNDAEAHAFVEAGSFQNVPAAHLKNELDQDGGASSWYYYHGYNSYYYGSMYWYGSWYTPCHQYYYGYYRYYYYSNYWW
ncbi:MAG: hypothetical protein ACXVCY_14520 [Pseudobdellovibrionaceae bacterium]